MAGKFKLNTGAIANLIQVVAGMPSGVVYDHRALEAAGVVTLANERDQANIRNLKLGASAVFTET